MITNEQDIQRERLVIIAGARGKMGETYLRNLYSDENNDVIGLTSTSEDSGPLRKVNLLEREEISRFVGQLNLARYKEVYWIHAIGPFLFEEQGKPLRDTNGDGIDDDTYERNFLSFQNAAEPLLAKINSLPATRPKVTLCAFGSIADRYNVPWWHSYSQSKNHLREYMRELVDGNTRAVFINVGSTEKEGERPLADKRYWLTCQEVFDSTQRALFDDKLYWQEVDVFRPNPEYHRGFFSDHARLRERWLHDMGLLTKSDQSD